MDQTFRPGSVATPTTLVEIAVSCRNLADTDILSKSDPMCVLFVKQFASDRWMEFGRTEVIQNCLNPNFVRKFVMDYFFEEVQKLKFELYDIDSPSTNLRDHDFLGSMECTLGEVVSSGRLQRKLTAKKLQYRAFAPHHASDCNWSLQHSVLQSAKQQDEVTLQFCAIKLDKKDFFGKSDPFLVFSRSNENDSYTVVHKTEVVKCNLNPTWKPFTIPVRTLCNGDLDRVVKVECFDWNQSGNNELIGTFVTTVKELSRGPGPSNDYEVIDPKKKAKKDKKYVNSGTVKLLSCEVRSVSSFMDYIKGGTQVHCTFAVDFTASNGDPRTLQSLHYLDPYQPNLYARALRAVGEIIQDYDSTKLFPALGFGAKLPPNGVVSHEFFLNGHPSNPYCNGVQGVLDAYFRTLQTVQLYGPTNFSPVINHVARIASQTGPPGAHYFILLILTDGIITDMPQTCEAIVAASSLPLSIIIVGIGDADFEAMKVLDGDDVRLSSKGRFAERDIVQFVAFRDFIGGRNGSDLNRCQAMLAKEVLAEIPEQFVSYMKKYNIKPNPPRYEDIVS